MNVVSPATVFTGRGIARPGDLRDIELRLDRPAASDEIVQLHFLRSIAACGVVCGHLLSRYARRDGIPEGVSAILDGMGQARVAAFFAISGFILMHVALRRRDQRQSAVAFVRNRFLRLAPLYYLTTILMVAFIWATQSFSTQTDRRLPDATEWISSFLFLPYRASDGLLQPVYGLGWTLQYEMFFCLLFAAALMVGIRRAAWPLIATIVGLVLIGTQLPEPSGRHGIDIAVYYFTRPILTYFAIGIALALLRDRFVRRLPIVPQSIIMLVALAAMLWSSLDAERLMIGVTAALGITVLTVQALPKGPLGRGVQAISREAGKASYSTFLTHSFLLGAFASATASIAVRGPLWLMAMLTLACGITTMFGWLVWRLVESPIDRWVRRRSAESHRTGGATVGLPFPTGPDRSGHRDTIRVRLDIR